MRSRDALRPGGQSVGDWTEKKTPKNISDLYFPVALLVKTLKLPIPNRHCIDHLLSKNSSNILSLLNPKSRSRAPGGKSLSLRGQGAAGRAPRGRGPGSWPLWPQPASIWLWPSCESSDPGPGPGVGGCAGSASFWGSWVGQGFLMAGVSVAAARDSASEPPRRTDPSRGRAPHRPGTVRPASC